MKYTSASRNGLDQKGTDNMILEKQVGGSKAAKCSAVWVQLILGMEACSRGVIPANGRRAAPALLQFRFFPRDWLPAGPEVMRGR